MVFDMVTLCTKNRFNVLNKTQAALDKNTPCFLSLDTVHMYVFMQSMLVITL